MTRPHPVCALVVPLAAALLVLSGCGSDDSSGDGADTPTDAGTSASRSDDPATDGDADENQTDDADENQTDDGSDDADGDDGEADDDHTDDDQAADCVGNSAGKLTITAGSETRLPGGSSAALDSTDFDADPPTATLALGESTAIERKNASGLAVGDQFGLQRAVYKVTGICAEQVVLDEF